MPTALKPIIFGEKNNITLDKFNIGSLTKAIAFDLKELGERGVQGVAIKSSDIDRLVKYEKGRMKSPYIRAGVLKKDLVVVINDKDKANAKLEGMAVAVKDYVTLKAQLAKSSAEVVHVEPNDGNGAIRRNASAQAARLGTTLKDEDERDFGTVTGDVLLCAHGTPKISAGRVIGVKLGKKTPQQIVDLLIANKDQKKNLAKNYRGTITLSGCFTGSGGPEAHEADKPFAQKVKKLLEKAGYKNAVVSAFPGPMAVARGDNSKDDMGDKVGKGREMTWHDRYSEDGIKAMRKSIEEKTGALVKAMKAHDGGPMAYLQTPKGKSALGAIRSLEKEIDEARKEIEKAGDEDGFARRYLRGNFGLRVINAELKG